MTRKLFTLTTLSLLATALAVTTATPAAPPSVDTNAEKAAWEALMSPVGEYAAYATYDAIVQKYGQVEPYSTILRSEQMHINALTRQLQRYGLSVPANPYQGKITLPGDLKSIANAEAQTEIDNADLYTRLMAQAGGDAQLQRVFTNLQSASRDVHLVLFKKAAAGNGTLNAAEMTNFHTQNTNSLGQRGRGYDNTLGRGAGMGQRMRQEMGQARGQMMNARMNAADCPMMQGPGRGPGWRR